MTFKWLYFNFIVTQAEVNECTHTHTRTHTRLISGVTGWSAALKSSELIELLLCDYITHVAVRPAALILYYCIVWWCGGGGGGCSVAMTTPLWDCVYYGCSSSQHEDVTSENTWRLHVRIMSWSTGPRQLLSSSRPLWTSVISGQTWSWQLRTCINWLICRFHYGLTGRINHLLWFSTN